MVDGLLLWSVVMAGRALVHACLLSPPCPKQADLELGTKFLAG